MYFYHLLAFFPTLRISEALQGWDHHYIEQYMDLLNQTMLMREFASPLNGSVLLYGIRWCGPDEFIEDGQDLGFFSAIDECCRTHRFCPDYIEGFQTKYNLTNPVSYKRLHCDCDQKFYQCLVDGKGDEAITALVGKIYFINYGTQCFKQEHPIKKCEEEHFLIKVNHAEGIWRKKCVEYELDTEQVKIYQWFDLDNFPRVGQLQTIRNDSIDALNEIGMKDQEDSMEIP